MNWQFVSKIYKQRKLPYIDVPLEISDAMRAASDNEGYLSVNGTLNEIPIQALLVPRSVQKYRIFVTADIRQRAHVDVGDVVEVNLQIDFLSRETEVPGDLAEVLAADAEAQAAFGQLTPAKRNELIKWLTQTRTKKDEPRLKRLEHVCTYLKTGEM